MRERRTALRFLGGRGETDEKGDGMTCWRRRVEGGRVTCLELPSRKRKKRTEKKVVLYLSCRKEKREKKRRSKLKKKSG